ncbi:spore coat protein GerQ [Piscibacillus halophilus]|uniref:spore coat protein GerQ n=1 Tax=Piscibacillus halophilus TaxID=571933 RepID=UPI003CCD3B4B
MQGMGGPQGQQMPGMVQGVQQGQMPGMGQQGQMMPGMMQGGPQGQMQGMPGMMQNGPQNGQQGGQQQGQQQGQPMPPGTMMGQGAFPGGQQLPRERSYIENILRLNRGKPATLYFTFENNDEWNARVFRGIIEEAGKDHIVVSDTENNRWYLLLMIYLDYIVFDEEIEYQYPFG